jgi:hypothetical protein
MTINLRVKFLEVFGYSSYITELGSSMHPVLDNAKFSGVLKKEFLSLVDCASFTASRI